MKKKIVNVCPVCGGDLIITELKCQIVILKFKENLSLMIL